MLLMQRENIDNYICVKKIVQTQPDSELFLTTRIRSQFTLRLQTFRVKYA